MQSCEKAELLVDFLGHELPEPEQKKMEAHLLDCESCQEHLATLDQMQSVLLDRVRPEPPTDLLNDYNKRLERIFRPEPRRNVIKNYFVSLWETLFTYPTPGIRLAKVAVILIVGIFIGRSFLLPETDNESATGKSALVVLNVNPNELLLIQNYLVESEILLLGIINDNSLENGEINDFTFNREIAQKLLKQTAFVQEKTTALNIQTMEMFLNQLELILLEISNVDEKELQDGFNEIRQSIQEAGILHESQRVQKYLEKTTNRET